MKVSNSLTRAERINLWAQTIGIAAAGLWGFYVFVYKEFTQPRYSPVNITIELALQPKGTGPLAQAAAGGALTAVEVQMSARNPSSREIQLLSSAFVIFGDLLQPGSVDFAKELSANPVKSYVRNFPQRHARLLRHVPIAFGSAFSDTTLKPGEVIRRQVIIYVPVRQYDALTAKVALRTMRDTAGYELEWRFDPTKNSIDTPLFRLHNGKRIPVETDAEGRYKIPEGLEFREASAEWQIALVRNDAL
jgi:hypothetical protein